MTHSTRRCIPEDEIRGHVLKQLELVQLEASAGARANTLSGGMQRRLSVAVSLVGDPQIVLLGARLPLWPLPWVLCPSRCVRAVVRRRADHGAGPAEPAPHLGYD